MVDPTLRFSNRVDNYIKYRPQYPKEVIETLRKECQLTPASPVADIGAGTGALTKVFLQNGNQVFAVEPNREMREGAERLLKDYTGFRSIEGRAEATNLADQSVDFVVVGQAFHWFDCQAARREFLRILHPGGWAMVVWNEREFEGTAFLRAYEQLLQKYGTDYARVQHRQVYDTKLDDLYGVNGFESRTFSYRQEFDYEGARGRLLSSSYTPEAGHPNHEPMLAELLRIFRAHEVDGRVTFEYATRMYFGRLS